MFKIIFKTQDGDIEIKVPSTILMLILSDIKSGAIWCRIPKDFTKKNAQGQYNDFSCNLINLMRTSALDITELVESGLEEKPKSKLLLTN